MKRIRIRDIQHYLDTGQRDQEWLDELLNRADSVSDSFVLIGDFHYGEIERKTGDPRSAKAVPVKPSGRRIAIEPSKTVNLALPGDAMGWVIKRATGLDYWGNCSCNSIRKDMNKHGWWWCLQNIEQLWSKITQNAKSKGVQLRKRDMGKWLVRASLNVGAKLDGNKYD